MKETGLVLAKEVGQFLANKTNWPGSGPVASYKRLSFGRWKLLLIRT